MKQISRREKDWLIKNNILELIDGEYLDLAITCRNKKSRRKKYFVPDYMYVKVKLMYSESK